MGSNRGRVFCIGSWAPGVRMLLRSSMASCGCVVGVYELWSGQRVDIVDQAGSQCRHGHEDGERLPAAAWHNP